MIKFIGSLVTLASIGVSALTLQAKTCVWTGGGAASNFNDPLNWGGETVAEEDVLEFVNSAGSELVVSNDLASGFVLKGIKADGPDAVRIVGETLTLKTVSSATIIESVGPLTVDSPIVLTDPEKTNLVKVYVKLTADTGSVVLNGNISGAGKTEFILSDGSYPDASKTCAINGVIDLPNGGVSFSGGKNSAEFHVYGKVTAGSVNASLNGTLARGMIYLYHTDNDIGSIQMSLRRMYIQAKNGLGPNACVTGGYGEFSSYYISDGCDQVIDRFVQNSSYKTPTGGNAFGAVDASSSFVLTMRATDNGICTMNLINGISTVWDPRGDYTLEFTCPFAHSAKGGITVKRGRISVTAAATFKKVPALVIGDGAGFAMTGGSTDALAGLTKVTVGTQGTLTLGENEVTPLAVGQADFEIEEDSVLNLGVDLVAKSLLVGGQPKTIGTYGSVGSGCEHEVGWIVGAGKLTVSAIPDDNYYKGGATGEWNVAGNWLYGIPGTDKPVLVTRNGDTAVSISTPAAEVKHFTMENKTGTSTLCVTSSASFKTGKFTLGHGARVSVGEGGEFTYNVNGYVSNASTPTLTIADNARFEVSGGDAVFTNLNGKVRVGGGDASVTGALAVASGSCVLHNSRAASFVLDEGGRIEMSGGALDYYFDQNDNTWHPLLSMTGGCIDLSGNAKMSVRFGHYKTLFGTGVIRLRGMSEIQCKGLGSNYRLRIGPMSAGGTLDFTVEDSACFNCAGLTQVGLGENTNGEGGKTRVLVKDCGRMLLGVQPILGERPGGYAEVTVKDRGYIEKSGVYALSVGRSGTAAGVSEGVLKVQGGAVVVGSSQNANYPTLNGLIIGDGASSAEAGAVYNRGRLELSGGVVSNRFDRNRFVVGAGDAEGVVVQTGGLLLAGYNKPSHIGWHGGIGTYEISGGTADFGNQSLIIGADNGTGTLSFKPGDGLVTAKDVSFEGEKATLKFTLAADGAVSTMALTGALTVGEGGKLVVDASACTEPVKTSLARYASLAGSFAEEDIEILPPAGKHADDFKVVQGSKSLTFRAVNGFVLMVR